MTRLTLWTLAVVAALTTPVVVVAAPSDVARVVVRERGELASARLERRLVAETAKTRTFDVRVLDEDGFVVELFVREPKRPRERLAGMLLLAGRETGRQALDLVEERDDVVVMSMSYPEGRGPELEPTGLTRLRQTAWRAIDGAVLAVDSLAEREDIDQIMLVGVSFGALLATPVAAHDDRVDALVLIYGGGDVGRLVAANPPPGLGWVPRAFLDAGGQAFAGDFDPLQHIEALSPRPLLMANSTSDETFPRASAEALYERARQPKELLWFDTGHSDLFDLRVVAGITAEVIEVLEGWGLMPDGEAAP